MKLNNLRKVLNDNTQKNKANKSANQVIINLIDLCERKGIDCDFKIIDTTFNGSLNRGVMAECLVKALLSDSESKKSAVSKSQNGADFIKNGVKYEIKCSTSKGYAHYNPKQDLSNLIFVDGSGIYLTNGDNIILDKCCKHIKTIKMNRNVKVLYSF